MYPPILVEVEGLDGTGKTWLARRLTELITEYINEDRANHIRVEYAKEPWATQAPRFTWQYPLEPRYAYADALALVADRVLHLEYLRATASGAVVVMDRYHSSTLAYQYPWLREPQREELDRLIAPYLIEPVARVYLVPPEHRISEAHRRSNLPWPVFAEAYAKYVELAEDIGRYTRNPPIVVPPVWMMDDPEAEARRIAREIVEEVVATVSW